MAVSLLMTGCICKGGNFGIEFAGGATLQTGHVPICTLPVFGRLPRLTTKIFRLYWVQGLMERVVLRENFGKNGLFLLEKCGIMKVL